MLKSRAGLWSWALIFLAVLLWSGNDPKERFTWYLEVAPAVIGALILAFSYRSFRLTPLLYILILIHCIILMVGGHYTYAEVPLFDTLGEVFGFERNNYDKLGHLAQGFVPVMIAREVALRQQVFTSRAWMNFFVVCFALALSAFYELLEWWVALTSDEGAEAFLGTQGYVWDTQSDMFMALIGAVLALFVLSKAHDQQLRQLAMRD